MFLKSVVKMEDLPQDDRPHVVLVGRSNVGKSSLINALYGVQGMARVSAEPGRTQTLNFYQLEKSYYLVDLPGYGYAKTSKAKREEFATLILNYLREGEQITLVLSIIDARHGTTELDKRMLGILKTAKIPVLMVATKADKLTRQEAIMLDRSLTEAYPDIPHILHSTEDGRGRGLVLDAIAKAVHKRIAERKE